MTSFLHGTGVAKADRAGGGSLRRIILSTTAIAALAYGMSGQSGWSQDLIINDASTPNPTVFDSDQTFDTITVEDGGNATSGYFVFDAPVTVTANDALILNSTETHTVGAGEVLNAGTATIKSDLNISNGGTFSVTEGLETLGTVEIAGSSTANALTVNGGTLSVTPDGDLTVTGATDIGAGAFSNDGEFGTGSLTVTSETGSFDNTGTATVTNDFTDETVGNTVTNTGTLNIGGTMTVDGAVSQSGSGVITATTGASLGSLSLSDMSEFASDGEVTLGTLNAGSQTSLSGASITLTGDGTLDGTITGDLEVSDTTEDGSALSVSNGGTIEDDLTLSATTTAETDGVIFTNDNTIKGNVTVGTGSADSTNLTLINTNLIEGDITSYGVVQSAGQVDGDVTANAGTLEFADGASVGGTVTVGDAATLSLGTYGNSGGPAVIITGDLVADGDISSTGANALAIDGTFSSSGTIKADTGEASITAGTINLRDGTVLSEVNGGTLSFSADAINYGIAKTITDPTLNYDLGVIDGATVTIASELNGDGHDLNVTDGTLSVDADTTQIGVTTVASDGIVTVGSGIELEFSSLTNDGTVNLGESATLTGTGNTYTNNGTTNVSDNATIQDAGAIENSGLLRFEGSATLNSDTNSSGGEIITNTGTLDLTTLTNADPTVDALDDLTSTGGSALIQLAEDTELTVAGTLTNADGASVTIGTDATVSASDDVVNTSGSTITVGMDGTLSATNGVLNDDTATLDVNGGTVSGALDNSATVTFAGTMTGNVANTGVFTVDGDSTMAGDFDNEDGGTLTVNEDLTGITTLTNTGTGSTVTVGSGATLGATSLVNELTATLDVNGGTVSGALDNSATVTFAGTMTGDVANTGSFTIDGDSTMAGDFDNEDGGTLTVNEDLTGITTLTNAGAGSTVTVGGGATLGTTNIDNSATFSSLNNSVVSTGTFDNETGGFFTNAGDFDATGAVTNDNQITNTSTGTFDADALTNSGTFTNTGGVVGATDPLIVQNSGTISNQGTGTFGAVTVNNTTGGVVTNASDATMTMTALTNAATVTNQGMFTAEEIETTGTFTNTDGTVTVTGLEGLENGGTLTNQSDGVVTTTLLDNSGNLSNLDTSVFNAAEVTNGGPTASLVNQGDFNVTGMVSNTGSITTSGTFDSGLLQNYLSFVNDGGTVGGTAADAIDNDGTLTNQNAGVLNATDIDNSGNFSNLDTSVVNTATFDNEGAGSLVNQGDFNASGAVTNLNSINNTGTFDAASIDNDATFVNNGGTVGGTTAGSIDSSDTLTNQNDAELTATTITNSGTLSNLDTSSVTATTSVTNTGSITSFGTFDTAALDNDMTFVNDGGTVGGTTPGSIDNDGTLTNQNAAELTATDIDNNGSFSNLDTSIINTATFDNEGAGSLVNQGDLNASGAVTNLNSINNTGTFDAASIDNDATFVNNGGIVGGTTPGSIDTSGTLTNQTAGVIFATDIDNSGTMSNLDTSTVNGSTFDNVGSTSQLTNAGTMTLTGAATNEGNIDNTGAFTALSFDNDGSVDNDGTFTAPVDNSGSFDNSGTVIGAVSNSGGFDNTGGITGDVDNDATGDFDHDGTITGDVSNSGAFQMAGMIDGDFDNFADGTFTIDGNSTIDGALDNMGTLENDGSGLTLAVTDGFINTGTIQSLDMFTIDTASIDNTSGRIDLGTDDAADDVLVLTGTVAGGTLAFDIDLGDSTGATDQIVLSSLTGNVLLEFDTLDSGAILNDPLQVVDGNAVSALLTSTGLPARSGPLSYQVTQSSEGVFVNSVIDPGAAAVSGNLALVQSLIGTIVNRPSSPFVSGLAYESEDTCGSGAWARATGGRAEATSRTDNGQASLPATVDADFYGFVTGYDFGCFNSAGGEWDVAVGGILGINSGSTEQKVFEVGVSGADIVLTDNQISTTRSDFDQRYVGGYVAAARGAFTGDVQLRFENTDYEFDNESLGLYDEETSSNGTTLSASISYSHALSDTLTFVPTAGFGITRTSTDDLVFRDNSGTEIGRIDFDDHTTKIGFVGGTLAHTTIAPSGTEAYNSFVTATYYEDFSDDMTSKYRIGNDSQDLSTDPLGGFGELSVGLSYIKILDGEVGAAKQFNASVRADARFSDDVEAFSITAQARLQF